MQLREDMLLGALFVGFGVTGVIGDISYGIGSVARMGPGFLPAVAGAILAVLGLVLAVRSLVQAGAARFVFTVARPFAAILLAVVVFGATVESLGVVPALVLMTLIAWKADRSGRPLELLIVSVVLVGVVILIFGTALGLPLKLVPDAWTF